MQSSFGFYSKYIQQLFIVLNSEYLEFMIIKTIIVHYEAFCLNFINNF